MIIRRFIIVCTLIFVGVVAAIAHQFNTLAPMTNAAPAPVAVQRDGAGTVDNDRTYEEMELAPFEFQRTGAASPEVAAETLFLACATRSPKHFVQHLLLGVCDGPINTLQKFAECLHSTRFHHGENSLTVYDFEFNRGIDREQPIRAIASQDFDRQDKQVAALQFQMMSTYYGEQFKCIDVAGKSYDGLDYRTRIVVARVKDRWYAMPRCRSSKSFFEIADAMRLPSLDAPDVK